MVIVASSKIHQYFNNLKSDTVKLHNLANEAKKTGIDPQLRSDIPLAASVAERVEAIMGSISPNLINSGVTTRISELEQKYGFGDWRVALVLANEIANEKFCKFDEKIDEVIKESKKNEKVEMIKDFFELQKLKNFFLTSSAYDHENTIDKKLFTRILRKFKSETAEWNGEFIVVYLPEWNRFNQKSFTHFFHKKKIESIIKSLNIPYIDMVQEFEKEEDPINFYPFGLFGHYTAEGYRLVAESIFKNITD